MRPLLRRRRRTSLLIGLAVLAGVIGASALSASTASARAKSHSAAKPVRGGTLVVGLDQESVGFSPWNDAIGIAGRVVATGLFQTLMAPNANGVYVPNLARSVTPSKRHTVWTIRLPKGIKFADGTPLTAYAVRFDLIRHLVPTAVTSTAEADIKQVRVLNKYKLQIVTKAPWAALPADLSGQFTYLPSPTAVRKLGVKKYANQPIGNGPYKFQSWVRNSQLTLVRNPYYSRKDNYLNKIVFKPIPSEADRVAALEAGNIDMMYTQNGADIKRFAKDKRFKVYYAGKAIATDAVALNTAVAPFNNLKVRQALAYALNRPELVKVAFDGVGKVTNTPFDPGSRYHAKVAYPNYDPAKAKSLIQAYEKSTGTSQISITLGVDTNSVYEKLAQLIQAEWEAVGINVQVAPVDEGTLFVDAITGKFQADVWPGHPGFLDPDGWMYNFYYSKSGLNIANYKNKTLDKLILKGRETANPKIRKAAYVQIQKILAKELPWIYIRHSVMATIAYPWVHGIDKWTLPNGQPGYYGQEVNVPFSVEGLWVSKH